MYSKWIIFVVLGSVLCLQGCETSKGLRQTGKGIVKDVKTLPKSVKKADSWMQENLW